jgi:hypothetical protein
MTDGGCVQEVHDRSLEDAVQAARQAWNKLLGRISIDDVGPGYTAQQEQDWLTGFYSSLYRAAKFPRKLFEQDADGNTVHYSPNTGKVLPGVLSADQGFWDAYRTTYSLLSVRAASQVCGGGSAAACVQRAVAAHGARAGAGGPLNPVVPADRCGHPSAWPR